MFMSVFLDLDLLNCMLRFYNPFKFSLVSPDGHEFRYSCNLSGVSSGRPVIGGCRGSDIVVL